jgi:hypothetical protein
MALGFGCPRINGRANLSMSYGSFDRGVIAREGEGAVTCNYLGVDWPTLSAARVIHPTWSLAVILGALVLGVLV